MESEETRRKLEEVSRLRAYMAVEDGEPCLCWCPPEERPEGYVELTPLEAVSMACDVIFEQCQIVNGMVERLETEATQAMESQAALAEVMGAMAQMAPCEIDGEPLEDGAGI